MALESLRIYFIDTELTLWIFLEGQVGTTNTSSYRLRTVLHSEADYQPIDLTPGSHVGQEKPPTRLNLNSMIP